MVERMEWR
jgi:serine/threonine protein kinase